MKKIVTAFAILALFVVLLSCAPRPEVPGEKAPEEKAPEAKERGGIPQIEITPITMPPKPEVEPPPTPPTNAT